MTKCLVCDCCGEKFPIDDSYEDSDDWGVFIIKGKEVLWDLCENCSQRLINTLTDWELEEKKSN